MKWEVLGFSSCLLIIILLLLWRVLEWVWFGPKRLERLLRNQGFHGNPYKPVNGDLNQLLAMNKQAHSAPISLSDHHDVITRVDPFGLHTVNRHGKKSFMWFGPAPHVIITEPELIKEIMSKHFIFQKPKQHPLAMLVATGTATYNHDKWTKHRRIVNPAFHLEKLKNMLSAFYESCSEMTNAWEKSIKEFGEEIDVWPQIKTLSADVISRTAFGSSYEEGRKIFQLQREQIELLQALAFFHIPGYRFLPTKVNRRMKQIAKEMNDLLMGLIDKRLEAIKDGKGNNNDLLAILLESNLKEIDQLKEKGEKSTNVKGGMNIQDVIGESKLFYLAGQETTASLLVWTMVLLSKHQDWQIRARDEILQAFGNNGTPDFNGLSHLKIVTAILYEVLRLYPPLVSITRVLLEDTKLGPSTVLPKGVTVSIPIYLLHHDKEIWGDDVNEFNPERFVEGVSKATKSQVSYFPFGWGPRICIGQNFALLEAKMALVMILQRFSLELSPSYAHAPCPAILVQPQFGAHLILRKI
ncbi:cytochrome P450 CYP72A219-like [Impatiens glandulifera]|uniref:cytochrome P450 CYP72A219-like n=1 Tax=Impatiens glandulifera TaxID=253017 RepID=UPI001FB104AA|nr:cytochrome P450 CYP72A219-like [Impatiens glandulifera]